jgi:hypothetical protein
MKSVECQKIILDTKLTPFEKSRKLWEVIYKSVGRELPKFFEKQLEETQMMDSIQEDKGSILNALKSWIVDRCRALDTGIGDDGEKIRILDAYKTPVDRLMKLIDRELISCVWRDREGRFVFSRSIIAELERFGVKQMDLPSLRDAIPESVYTKNGTWIVRCSAESLTKALNRPGETVPSLNSSSGFHTFQY